MDTMIRPTETERSEPPGPSWGSPGVVILLVLAALVVLAAIAWPGSDNDAATRSSSPATTASAAPTTLLTEADWSGIVRGILATANELRINPNPSKLALYMEPSNPAFGEAVFAQGKLADGTWRYDPAPVPPRVTNVRVVAAGPTSATLDVSTVTPRYRVVDREGTVVHDTASGAGILRWTLTRSGDTWRLAAAAAL